MSYRRSVANLIFGVLALFLMYSCNPKSVESDTKGIEFKYSETEGTLNESVNIEKMQVVSNLNIPKAIFGALVDVEGDSSTKKFIKDFYRVVYQINTQNNLEISTVGYDQNIDFVVLGIGKELESIKSELASEINISSSGIDPLSYLKTIKIDDVYTCEADPDCANGENCDCHNMSKDLWLKDFWADRWLQDFGEFIGYVESDDGEKNPAIYYVRRDRRLKKAIEEIAMMLDIPFIRSSREKKLSGNNGGNIEVTPDGILFYGNTMDEKQVQDFHRWGYSKNSVELDTSWLIVGHVDEYISVIPSNYNVSTEDYHPEYKGPITSYSLVVADPLYGLDIIYRMEANDDFYITPDSAGKDKRYINDIKKAISFFQVNTNAISINSSNMDASNDNMDRCLDYAQTLSQTRNCRLIQYNIQLDKIINKNIDKLAKKTPFLDDKIIKIPGFYRDEKFDYCMESSARQNWCRYGEGALLGYNTFDKFNIVKDKGVSFLPGSANLVVLRDHLILPDPSFEPFKSEIYRVLNPVVGGSYFNRKVHFIDDKSSYHDLMGEVHCGTNVMREPNLYFEI